MTAQHRDFDQAASQWDEDPGRVKLAGDIHQAMLRNIAFTPQMDILDFGCGTGLVSHPLASQVRSVTGADTSRGMIDIFQSKARSQGLSNVQPLHLRHGEPLQGSYDVVLSSMAFHHVENTDALLADMFRALKSPGFLGIADLDPDHGEFHQDPTGVFHSGFDRAAMQASFERAGFTRVRATTAAEITKPGRLGQPRTFTVFLVVGEKP